MTIFTAIIASLAAFLGGAIALRFKDKLHIIIGFSAGAVIGAALLDLIPEAIEIGEAVFHPEEVTALVVIGFVTYLILDRIFSFHHHTGEDIHDSHKLDNHETIQDAPRIRGTIGAASFLLHSLIDGLAIGFSFQAGVEVGIVVAVAVIAHRFSDGINTVSVILRHRGGQRSASMWLVAVAGAPIVGAACTFLVRVSDTVLAVLLAVFAGFFLYIGASDLIPEGNHSHSKVLTTAMTIMGVVVLYVLVCLAHG